uniref:Uncharacterized protein n=1 Tax=Timema genevievae TaxID=629358 RepID=A0A7R9K0F2_TIMGE|nr:unnamed protein product [Timema genevievae]
MHPLSVSVSLATCATIRSKRNLRGIQVGMRLGKTSLALQRNDETTRHWIRIRDEHSALLHNLQSIAIELSHQVMVPIGSKALVRGKMVHTNEILVCLGDGCPSYVYTLSLPPVSTLSLPPVSTLSLPPVPTLSLPPVPTLSLPPVPTICHSLLFLHSITPSCSYNLSLPPVPTLSLPPVPTLCHSLLFLHSVPTLLCDEMLDKLEKERNFLTSQKQLPVEQEAFASEEQSEIVEPYNEEQEAEWRVRHRQKEQEYRQRLAELRNKEKTPVNNEEDLWQRLDQLELEEELQEELDRLKVRGNEVRQHPVFAKATGKSEVRRSRR